MPPSVVSSASWLPATTCGQPRLRERSAWGTLALNTHPPNRERLPLLSHRITRGSCPSPFGRHDAIARSSFMSDPSFSCRVSGTSAVQGMACHSPLCDSRITRGSCPSPFGSHDVIVRSSFMSDPSFSCRVGSLRCGAGDGLPLPLCGRRITRSQRPSPFGRHDTITRTAYMGVTPPTCLAGYTRRPPRR